MSITRKGPMMAQATCHRVESSIHLVASLYAPKWPSEGSTVSKAYDVAMSAHTPQKPLSAQYVRNNTFSQLHRVQISFLSVASVGNGAGPLWN